MNEPKIKEKFKMVYEILIDANGIDVKYFDGKGGKCRWRRSTLFEKDFKIIGDQYGENAGTIKIEIG